VKPFPSLFGGHVTGLSLARCATCAKPLLDESPDAAGRCVQCSARNAREVACCGFVYEDEAHVHMCFGCCREFPANELAVDVECDDCTEHAARVQARQAKLDRYESSCDARRDEQRGA
jgi:DNA-directed RNA polymerase subunit RPC12/RpoP